MQQRANDSSKRYADTSCNFIQVATNAATESSAPYETSDTGDGYDTVDTRDTRGTGSRVSSKYVSSGSFDYERSGAVSYTHLTLPTKA